MNSTHKVEVVRLNKIDRHPNADSLEVSSVFNYSVVFKEGQYKENDLVCFVPPDSVMPLNDPQYEWLGPKRLVRAKKLRGVPSFGLLLKAPDWAREGEDLCQHFGVSHYEPPLVEGFKGGEAESPPKIYAPVYDVETIKKYRYLFTDGEPVNALEKIHGQSWRGVYTQDEGIKVGSRNEWKKYTNDNTFWKSLEFTPNVKVFLEENPGIVVYAESAGNVQKGFPYGVPKGQTRLFIFDVLKDGKWMDYKDARKLTDPYGLVWCPEVVTNFPFDFDKLCEMAELKTRVPGAGHLSEGVVVAPIQERYDRHIGRVKLKLVSSNYLSLK